MVINNQPYYNGGKTMPCLPPMTGNGLYIPPIKMVMTGGWFIVVFTHIAVAIRIESFRVGLPLKIP